MSLNHHSVELERLLSILECSSKAFLAFNRTGHILAQYSCNSFFNFASTKRELGDIVDLQGEVNLENLLASERCRKQIKLFEKESNILVSLTYQRINDEVHLLIAEEILSSSENLALRYEFLFRNSVAGIFRTKLNGEFVEVNQAYLAIFGFERLEELKQQRSIDFYLDPEDRKVYLDKLMANRELKNYVIRNRRLDGEEVFLLTNAVFTIENGEEFIDGILIDVTELRNREEQIKTQNKRLLMLEHFLEESSEAIQVVNKEGRFVYMNRVARERQGFTEKDYRAYSVFDIESYFKNMDDWRAELAELKAVGSRSIEGSNKNIVTGRSVPVEVNASYWEMEGEPYIIASIRDISQRKLYEEKLAETNRFLNVLNLAIDKGSLVTETDIFGNITYANEKFCEVSQYSLEEIIGKNHSIVNSGNHSKEFWSEFWNTIRRKEVWSGEICNKAKDGHLYWVRTLIYPVLTDDGTVASYLSVRQDITREKEQEERLKSTVRFQELVLSISNRFVNVPLHLFEESLNASLDEIGKFVDVDRVYVFSYDHQKETCSNTYEWCQEGISPQIENLQNIPFSEIQEWISYHFNRKMINVHKVDELPKTRFKELLEEQEIKSVLAIPMFENDVCSGFIGFDAVRDYKNFEDQDIAILKLFSEMLVNIGARIRSLNELSDAKNEIERINANLEIEIFEKRRENTKLTTMLSEHEKLAMLGEIAAGVAHDLNTPLGSIKVGIESIRFTLENLFKSVIEKCSADQLHKACERAVKIESELTLGGLQVMKETKALQEILYARGFVDSVETNKLASAMVKARISATDLETIEYVLAQENSTEVLDMMYHIQTIRTLVDTIVASGDKASSVVSSLRTYLNNSAIEERKRIDLSTSISTILKVFGYELKNKMDVQFDVPEIFVSGFENKLYQLWSNIIKNAIEAVESHGKMEISYSSKEAFHSIVIRNDGPMIEKDVLENMFKKFYTTKSQQKGTGLGLSIVKRIINDHNGQIVVTSDENWTTFEILLPKIID